MILCECGRPRRGRAASCSHCRALDGGGEQQQAVVMALYVSGCPLTVRDIAEESGISYKAAAAAVTKLVRQGRLVVVDVDAGNGCAHIVRLGPVREAA